MVPRVITCHLRYIIDSSKVPEFEAYCRMWLKLIPKFGGTHHGYLLPSEGEQRRARIVLVRIVRGL